MVSFWVLFMLHYIGVKLMTNQESLSLFLSKSSIYLFMYLNLVCLHCFHLAFVYIKFKEFVAILGISFCSILFKVQFTRDQRHLSSILIKSLILFQTSEFKYVLSVLFYEFCWSNSVFVIFFRSFCQMLKIKNYLEFNPENS